MELGICKWFSDTKGYGFLIPKNGDSRDVFVHYKAIVGNGDEFRTLETGELVEYEAEVVDGKLRATSARPVARSEAAE